MKAIGYLVVTTGKGSFPINAGGTKLAGSVVLVPVATVPVTVGPVLLEAEGVDGLPYVILLGEDPPDGAEPRDDMGAPEVKDRGGRNVSEEAVELDVLELDSVVVSGLLSYEW